MDNYKVNINVNKLRNEVQARENRKFKTFEKVLEMCYQKILSTNKTCDECCCTFICPQVVFGLPLFNLIECINFIMEKLIEKGFETHLALPNHIFISWKPQSEERAKYSYLPLGAPQPKMQLEYNNNSYTNTNSNTKSRNNERKLFTNNPQDKQKQKNYRSIDDYNSNGLTNVSTYDTDDISLFQSKINELFT